MKMKYTKNIYFLYKEVKGILVYRIILNVKGKDKQNLYNKEKDGFKICKVLANER